MQQSANNETYSKCSNLPLGMFMEFSKLQNYLFWQTKNQRELLEIHFCRGPTSEWLCRVSSPSRLGDTIETDPFSITIIVFGDFRAKNSFVFYAVFMAAENKLLFSVAHLWSPKIRLFSVAFFRPNIPSHRKLANILVPRTRPHFLSCTRPSPTLSLSYTHSFSL
jgi:hypothetical protein